LYINKKNNDCFIWNRVVTKNLVTSKRFGHLFTSTLSSLPMTKFLVTNRPQSAIFFVFL
jgi:hypothetical protein